MQHVKLALKISIGVHLTTPACIITIRHALMLYNSILIVLYHLPSTQHVQLVHNISIGASPLTSV
jgi:hypothetical protein